MLPSFSDEYSYVWDCLPYLLSPLSTTFLTNLFISLGNEDDFSLVVILMIEMVLRVRLRINVPEQWCYFCCVIFHFLQIPCVCNCGNLGCYCDN